MDNLKYIAGALVLVVIGVLIGHLYFSASYGAVSPAGTTYGDAKFAGVSINLASPGANGTSTSILNTDANARFVTAWKLGCTGVGTSQTAYTGTGLASLQLTIGTTSTAAPTALPANGLIANATVLATGTPQLIVASSSLQTGSAAAAIWWPNTYMTFGFNATNTAVCSIGVDYMQS